MFDFSVYYIEANIVCILIFGILLVHNHFNIDRQEKQIKYDRVLIAFMLYFLMDCFWAAIVTETIPKTRLTVVINTFCIYLLMGATVYYWLNFVMAYEQAPHRNRPINRFAVIFPFLVSTLALILQYIIAPQTLINDAQDTLPGFDLYIIIVPDIYVIAVLFYTIRNAKIAENPAEKSKHLFIGLFPLLVSLGGLIQSTLYPHIPIYCFTSLILMLVFYIQSIEIQVSVDPLTSLNNRGQLARYISQKSNLRLEGKQTVVIMMDIDNFKAINDNYGHAEGDNALVIIADALKKVINSHSAPSFLGRYGGDEFILILHPDRIDEADQLIREIRGEVARHDTPYPLSISAGYDELADDGDTIQSCIRRADKKLYLDKGRKNIRSRR